MVFSNTNFKDRVKEHELEKFLNILFSVNLKFQSSFMSQLHQTTLRIDVHKSPYLYAAGPTESIYSQDIFTNSWKIMSTLAAQPKTAMSGWEGGPSTYPAEDTPSCTHLPTNITSHNGPALPLYHWSLQKCQTDQSSRYSSIWADITRTFLESGHPCISHLLLIVSEVLAVKVTSYKSHKTWDSWAI